MKKSFRKATLGLLVGGVLAVGGFAFTSMDVTHSYAAEEATTVTYQTTDIQMKGGAQIYVNPNAEVSGIRFTAQTESVNENYTYGMMIVPYDYFVTLQITPESDVDFYETFTTAYEAGTIAKMPLIKEGLIPEDNEELGCKTFSLSIDGVREQNYTRRFVGIAFVKEAVSTDDPENPDWYEYKYAKITDENVRDITYISSVLLATSASNYTETQVAKMQEIVRQGINNVDPDFSFAIDGATSANVGEYVQVETTIPSAVRAYAEWSVSDPDIARVDETGVVDLLSTGEVTVTVSVAGGLYEDSLIIYANEAEIADNVIASVSNADNFVVHNSNNTETPVAAADLQSLYELTGNYEGDALMYESTAGTMPLDVNARISETRFDEIAAQGYTQVTFWVAAYADNGASVRINADSSLYEGDATVLVSKEWTKITFALDYVNSQNGYTLKSVLYDARHAFRAYLAPGSDRLNADETKTTLHFFVGDVVFEESTKLEKLPAATADELLKMSNAGALEYIGERNNSKPKSFVTADELKNTYGISGDYTGNAVLIEMTGGLGQINLTPRADRETMMKAIQNGATTMSIWVAGYAKNDSTLYFNENNSIYLDATKTVTKTWQRIDIKFDKTTVAALCEPYENSPNQPLFGTKSSNYYEADGTTRTTLYYFIGDITYNNYEIADNVVASTYFLENYNYYSADSKAFVTNAQAAAEDITGDYTGNAVKLLGKTGTTSGSTSVGIIVTPKMTRAAFDALVKEKGYTKISVWVAAWSDCGQTVGIRKDTNTLYNSAFAGLSNKTWTKVSLTLSATPNNASYTTVADALFNDGGARLFRFSIVQSATEATQMHMFVGDVVLEK